MANSAIMGASAIALDALNFSRPTASFGEPGRPGSPTDSAAIDQAAEDFEAQVLGIMLNQMFSQVKTDGLFGGGQGEEMFRSLLVDQYGTMIAEQGGLGLADQVRSELLRMQEAA